ncbi:deoxyguanosinetriphosphate triphosphohydrolase [Nostoc sp. NIES-3756]|uniref:deoxyguanosinetriphosphate triphosphohydrolase n=1 Tax=Nostoc sp. NIES-3756 TaxID=1751286 RepID=UPI00082A52F0|nr:deoxyguanosinetriphosphate triphosphohydrolase [Nostoc sp. NIES-3756]
MEWNKLLCSKRQGHEEHPNEDPHNRNPFERDLDRIVFSESFRRLKDKTQVFPVNDNDHVHNRLTHSLEVSCIGRSLGRIVGVYILDKHKETLAELVNKEGLNEASFGAIVQAACLAHDIGNPPFGHSGENAIQAWFYSETGQKYLENLTLKEREDLELFEGNAQGFRIITRIEGQTKRMGMQLTYATLATFSKYPRESLLNIENNDVLKHERQNRTSAKKYGFFQSEKKIFEEVADKVGLIRIDENLAWWCRHPLAFLVEAADDICYLIMDFEDGFNTGYIDYNTTRDLLIDIAGENYLNDLNQEDDKSSRRENIRFLRGKAINKLIDVAVDSFKKHESELLAGSFDSPLLSADNQEISQKIKNIKDKIKEKVYKCQEVLSIEVAGYDVVSGLLNEFVTAVNDEPSVIFIKRNHKGDKIREMLPRQTIFNGQLGNESYLNILKVTDYISGMTDSYAVSLFKKIKGISLG